MIENIVRRAKKLAIKREIAAEARVSAPTTFWSRSARSTRRTRTSRIPPTPTTGPASRARRGSGSSTVRTLMADNDNEVGGRAIERVGTGQYL